jgi:thiol-disulfide isomerase/thioredoxin
VKRNAFVAFVLLMFLSGCTAEEEQLIDEGGVEVPVAKAFPLWSAISHDASEMNGTMFDNTSYVAYFSAPWCAHCEATLDAYDQTLPAGKMMVFSYDEREDYSDMNVWHNKTELNLNRTIDRPFMLHPTLAQEVELSNIPYVLFVNEQGYIYHIQVGKITDTDAISNLWESTMTATANGEGRWL